MLRIEDAWLCIEKPQARSTKPIESDRILMEPPCKGLGGLFGSVRVWGFRGLGVLGFLLGV